MLRLAAIKEQLALCEGELMMLGIDGLGAALRSDLQRPLDLMQVNRLLMNIDKEIHKKYSEGRPWIYESSDEKVARLERLREAIISRKTNWLQRLKVLQSAAELGQQNFDGDVRKRRGHYSNTETQEKQHWADFFLELERIRGIADAYGS